MPYRTSVGPAACYRASLIPGPHSFQLPATAARGELLHQSALACLACARDDDRGHDAKAVSEAVGNKTGQDSFIHGVNDYH